MNIVIDRLLPFFPTMLPFVIKAFCGNNERGVATIVPHTHVNVFTSQ